MRELNIPTLRFGITLDTAIRPGLDQATEALAAEQLGYDVLMLHRDALHGDDPRLKTGHSSSGWRHAPPGSAWPRSCWRFPTGTRRCWQKWLRRSTVSAAVGSSSSWVVGGR
jgi:hypothetical protein